MKAQKKIVEARRLLRQAARLFRDAKQDDLSSKALSLDRTAFQAEVKLDKDI